VAGQPSRPWPEGKKLGAGVGLGLGPHDVGVGGDRRRADGQQLGAAGADQGTEEVPAGQGPRRAGDAEADPRAQRRPPPAGYWPGVSLTTGIGRLVRAW
jgi:hypothetical protein